tara:strand:+ start:14668 stop:15030 length:363 start_codon:yes stop_codon:yes gene_type:complete
MSNTTNNLKPVEANLIISNKNLPDGSVRTTAFYSTVVTKNVSIILDDDTAVESRFQEGNGRNVKPLIWFVNGEDIDYSKLPKTMYGIPGGDLMTKSKFEKMYGNFSQLQEQATESMQPTI